MSDDKWAFHVEEYKIIKGQKYSLTDKMSTIMQYVLGGDAAVFAWLFTHKLSVYWGLFIPPALSFFGVILIYIIQLRIGGIDRYLGHLENYLDDPDRRLNWSGWEAFREGDRTAGTWKPLIVGFVGFVFAASLVPLVLTWLGYGVDLIETGQDAAATPSH